MSSRLFCSTFQVVSKKPLPHPSSSSALMTSSGQEEGEGGGSGERGVEQKWEQVSLDIVLTGLFLFSLFQLLSPNINSHPHLAKILTWPINYGHSIAEQGEIKTILANRVFLIF